MRAFTGLLTIALAVLSLVAIAAPAQADDANSVPPQVKLIAAGAEGLIGPGKTTLARFSTEAPDPSWEYAPRSKVSVSCTIDGFAVPCAPTYDGCCAQPAPAPSSLDARWGAQSSSIGLGTYFGELAVPRGLSSGLHTVAVAATDEDGTGQPATLAVTYDATPPSAPELTQVPSHMTHERKPIFRFAATDGVRLISKRDEPFWAALRRLDPPGQVYRPYHGGGSYLSIWGPTCPTLRSCSGRGQAVYEAFERGFGYGVPERLVAGLYEFRVRARDAVGNVSPYTTYRFRIVPRRARRH